MAKFNYILNDLALIDLVTRNLYSKNVCREDKEELQNSKSNTSTRTLLIASRRINQIETVYNKLPKEDKQAVKKIFFEHHSQIYAEMNDGITKDMYYNIKNKMIYLTAIEFDLI